MTETNQDELILILAKELETDMLSLYGPTMFGKHLIQALGFGSADAFRQAVSRKTIPVAIFPIEKRKGKFALTKDVAYWLAAQRVINSMDMEVQ
jgi:hypothetical protein